MQSVAERKEVSNEEASVLPVAGLRKLCWERNIAAGCHQKLKGRIQANCESWKGLTIGGRRMTICARVAWFRTNVIREV
jgi:hypothetical protein